MGIANEGEILEFLTYIMRREDEEIRMADSFKAAELLGKHYGMFGGKSESGGGDVQQRHQSSGLYVCTAGAFRFF